MVLAMPPPPDLTGLTQLQQFVVLIVSAVSGALIWVFTLVESRGGSDRSPNIVDLENDRRDAEIVDKVRDILDARNVSIQGDLKEIRDDVQVLKTSVAVLESRVDRRPAR